MPKVLVVNVPQSRRFWSNSPVVILGEPNVNQDILERPQLRVCQGRRLGMWIELGLARGFVPHRFIKKER